MYPFPPHGACWFWDRPLLALHAIPDLLTFVAYALIPALALYVYRRGQLRGLRAAYPLLWRLGAAFILFCGLSHLGNFLELWYGGWLFYVTGANKAVMAATSLWYAFEFWRVRQDLVLIGRLLEEAGRQMRNPE